MNCPVCNEINLIPNPLDSETQYIRYHHEDIPQMENEDLDAEYYYIRSHIYLYKENDKPWLSERLAELKAEINKRYKNNKQFDKRGLV